MSDDAEADFESTPDADGVSDADATDAAADPGAGGEATDAESAETATETDLAARVAAVDEELAAEVAELAARADELDSEVADLRSKLKRKQADFQNYKQRTKRKQEQIKDRAAEDLVERLVPVRDNLLRALDQDEGADIRPGVESTLTELDRVLEDENVDIIEPDSGDEVDPHRHEVMLRVDADQPAGTVVDIYQPGYEMADKVLRPAQVTVSTGEGGDAAE
ncbi:nucleotide exchange factor GrpE [Salinigranum marinum]|uniref:nucleotide exchange factor GrpE n=1 Tax=Salinigranum marinum TaxID=1515595 RepID=UPI002989E608|nr:nucleotide exchange factor GrpE [Salinigranum marinum]